MNKLKIFTNGIIKENPSFVLLLGMCPLLAVTTSVNNAIGMGLAATAVLIGSNFVVSCMRKIIPDKIRIASYIVIIAGFVTLVQMLVEAFVPALYDALGVFLPLIVVNCIILARAESFASKNRPGLCVRRSRNGTWIYPRTHRGIHNPGAFGKRFLLRTEIIWRRFSGRYGDDSSPRWFS